MQAVCAALVFAPPGANKFSIGVKHHDRIVKFRSRANGVLDVNFALCVHCDAVRVAIDVASGQFAPVVDDFVLMFAFADNRQARAGLVVRNDVRGGREKRRRTGTLEKFAAV